MLRYALLAGIVACLPELPDDHRPVPAGGSAAAADVVFTGAVAGERLGTAGHGFAASGDFDGNGRDDLAFASNLADDDAGAVWVFASGVGAGSVESAPAEWRGVAAGDYAGHALLPSDVNGDGVVDLVVGAPRNADGAGTWTGAVYVLFDPLVGGGSLSRADAVVYGEAADDLAGGDLAALGDWDGDGTDDLLVGAIYNDRGATDGGAAYVVSGPLSGTSTLESRTLHIFGEGVSDRLGQSIAGADVNGDGVRDALVGSYGYGCDGTASSFGGVVVVYGPATGAVGSTEADLEWVGDVDGAQVGTYHGVHTVGDIDGDGSEDVALGASTDETGTRNGLLYVVYSGAPSSGLVDDVAGAVLYGEAAADGAGVGAAGVGDVDGDGTVDLLVSAPGSDGVAADAGRVYLVLGARSGAADLADEVAFDGEATGDTLGGVAAAGDQDGDGLPDFLLGAPGSDRADEDAGAAYLFNSASP